MKYITTRQADGTEEIFVFSKAINHDCMAEAVSRIRSSTRGEFHRVFREPLSAGFVEGGRCVGRSESLNLASRGEEDDLLLEIGEGGATAAVFQYDFRARPQPKDSYYAKNIYDAIPVSVQARTQEEARQLALAALGDPDTSTPCKWEVVLKRVNHSNAELSD